MHLLLNRKSPFLLLGVLAVVQLCLQLVASQTDYQAGCVLTGPQLQEVAKQYYQQAWSNGTLLTLNNIMALDHVYHDMIWQVPAVQGRQALKTLIQETRTQFPDLRFAVNYTLVNVEMQVVAVEFTATGTLAVQVGDEGPDDDMARRAGIAVLAISNCSIAETRVYRTPLIDNVEPREQYANAPNDYESADDDYD